MSASPAPAAGGRRSLDGLILAIAAGAAYVGFGAVMMLHDGPRAGHAQAGVPVDAVRAAVAARNVAPAPAPAGGAATARVRPAPPAQAAVGVGEVIREPRTAEAASNPLGIRSGLGAAGASVAAVGAEAGGGAVRLQFLVKLDEDQAMAWRDRYLENPAATREEWARFARSNPAFAGLKLERMNYSGEATLEFDGDAPTARAALEQLSDDIVRRLSAADGVEYAEPNLVGVREDGPQ